MPKDKMKPDIETAMREFISSDYNPQSGWDRAQYAAAQEATAHWLKYEKPTPPKKN